GSSVAVLHSSLGVGERLDEWKRIKRGDVSVVIGTRSAVFAPVDNLGLIIIDEEQEHTYKSENAPRYNAGDVAKYRCVHEKALLLLGSATPSLESMKAAREGSYSLFELPNRFNVRPLPQVMTADMTQELRRGNGSDISELLQREIAVNLDRGEQTILFLNRRGSASLVQCGECGHTYDCPNCSVKLTYHESRRRLICHYCGYSSPIPQMCGECAGKLKFTGAGTQQIDAELKNIFPGIETIRMDADTVSASRSHEKLLREFETGRVPVLIGTQMVTKGLDFENVTLVGVISADQLLYVGDYKASERAFSLMTQVIGRAGRGRAAGRAVIQTFTPKNEIISLAAAQDYMSFYRREMKFREAAGAPPFGEIITVTVTGVEESRVLAGSRKIAGSFAGYFENCPRVKVLGPAPAPVMRVMGRCRYRVSLLGDCGKKVRETVAHVIRLFAADRENRGLSAFADLSPAE
ncbi:MAG: primosomal protein N', partial [Oscillospiraceae bacterium]|nr:primosomal protein N' [Oscillospiraceae bacterium]